MNLLCSTLLGLSVLFADTGDTQTFSLAESAGQNQVRERIHLKVSGEIRTENGPVKMAGQALLEFYQKVLEYGQDEMAAKVVRFYPDARAKFVVGQSEDGRQLRANLRYMVGERSDHAMTIWSPGGPMTSDERELVEDVLDTTRLAGLLPTEPVAVGASWEPQPIVLQGLCGMTNFIESKLQCKLESTNPTHAMIAVEGSVHGLSLGAEIKSKIVAKCAYNLEKKIIDQVQWSQTDSRGPSPIAPAGEYTVSISINRTLEDSPRLSDEALADVSLEPKNGSKLLVFVDPQQTYRFYHDRNWYVTMAHEDTAILRRIEGSVFVAQLNIKLMKGQKLGAAVSADQLQQVVQQTAGWQIDEIVRMDELPTDGSFRLHMLAARGKQGEIPLSQKHYLVNASSGSQVIFSFITEQANEENLGTHDLSLVSSVEFPNATAAKEGGSVK